MIKYMPESLAFLVIRKENEKVRPSFKELTPSYVPNQGDLFEVHLPKRGMPVKKLIDRTKRVFNDHVLDYFFYGIISCIWIGKMAPQLMVQAGYPLTSSLLFLLALNIGVMIGNITGGWLAD